MGSLGIEARLAWVLLVLGSPESLFSVDGVLSYRNNRIIGVSTLS